MTGFTETYNYLVREAADKRVYNWPLMGEPTTLLGIILLYFYGIYVFLPSYMANRKPYSLKRIIAVYNIYQVVSCTALVTLVARTAWKLNYTLGCQKVDRSENELPMLMTRLMWWHVLVKLSELIETVFFSLRKKQNQISGLHVYHHVSSLVIAWMVCKYYPGGIPTFTLLMNSSVHVLMYTYYLLASLGPEMQKRLQPVKSKLTLIQIIQLFMILTHNMQMLLPSCDYPNVTGYLYLPNIVINIVLFFKFYSSSYRKKRAV